MVTVYEDTERIFKALRAGACGYLLKRCTPEELISAIREVRQGGAPMSREIARKVIFSFQEPLAAAAEVEDLSPREREILELLAEGFPNKQIADRVGVDRRHGALASPARLSQAACPLPHRGGAQVPFRQAG